MDFCSGMAEMDWKAVAAFITAGAAWTVAFLTYKIAKGYWKTNRQLELLKVKEKWLVSLRECMSEYIAEGLVDDETVESRRRFFSLHSKILLMMNPEKSGKKPSISDENSVYFVKFDEIQTKMNGLGKRKRAKLSVQSDMATLLVLFHQYLKYHWDLLQEEVEQK